LVGLVDLAQPRLGSRVVYATDDFFADKSRLIHPPPPVFIPDKFDDHGKWMDGWESRRKRIPGHDWCIVKLGVPGLIKGVDIDTSHFTGNFPPGASIEACVSGEELPADDTDWLTILPRVDLAGDSHHFHDIDETTHFTHLRLNIYPDGGVARLRVYGLIQPDWSKFAEGEILDLVALENGGQALACSDEHYGSMHNLNAPGRGVNMGDGWETARRRGPGHDWVVLGLGHAGKISRVEIDTAHFKGNYPDRASILAAYKPSGDVERIASDSAAWRPLLPEVKLELDQQHWFEDQIVDLGAVTHVRLNIFPDGGVSRIRLHGTVSD
jgi:allantoicase